MVRVALTSVERDCGGYCGVVGAYSALQYVYGIGIITRSDVRSVSCFADHFDLKNIYVIYFLQSCLVFIYYFVVWNALVPIVGMSHKHIQTVNLSTAVYLKFKQMHGAAINTSFLLTIYSEYSAS